MNRGVHAEYILAVILVFLATATYLRNSVWKNEYTLWSDVVKKSPNKAMPHVNLGNAFVRRGMLSDAENEFKAAINVNPGDIRAINGLAVVYSKQKNYDEAIRLFEILASGKPNEAPFHNNLGVIYMKKGLVDKAIEKFKIAIKVDPTFTDVHKNLGIAYKNKGMIKEARNEFERVLQLDPENIDAKRNLDEIAETVQKNRLSQ